MTNPGPPPRDNLDDARRLKRLELRVEELVRRSAKQWQSVPFKQVPASWFNGGATSFTRAFEANYPRELSTIVLRVITGTLAAGATGQYRVVCDTPTAGTVIATFSDSTVGPNVTLVGPITVPSAYRSLTRIGVEYMRSAGSGNIYCDVTDATQEGS